MRRILCVFLIDSSVFMTSQRPLAVDVKVKAVKMKPPFLDQKHQTTVGANASDRRAFSRDFTLQIEFVLS